MTDLIQRLIDQHREVSDILAEKGAVSLQVDIDAYLSKLAVIAVGSFFETELCQVIEGFLRRHAKDPRVFEFGIIKGINRQYHTWFNWKSGGKHSGVYQFFGQFGAEFLSEIKKIIERDENLRMSASAFLELGQMRNELAHGNLVTYSLSLTIDEVRHKYLIACGFVEFVRSSFPWKPEVVAGEQVGDIDGAGSSA